MKILGTGLQGLIGSRIVELLSSEYTFESISRSTGIDITDADATKKAIEQSNADIVLHLAAKADVDGCEQDKPLGKDGDAWKINVEGTRNVAKACEYSGKKLIFVSTDFVFDGEKETYDEQDSPNPINWYAVTKYEGEQIVQTLKSPWIITRIAYPYRSNFSKNDFVRAIKGKLEKNEQVLMVTDHIMTPTFTDDIAGAFTKLFQQDSGIYHVVGSEFLSPYEAAEKIATIFNLNVELIKTTTREVFFKNRAARPFHLALKNDKIRKLDVNMNMFTQGLEEVKRQLL